MGNMKLRNKKTGEIGDIAQTCDNMIVIYYPIVNGVAINPQHRAIYASLTELNEEWEDYEEPKEYWRIDCDGEIEDDKYEGTSFDKDCKAIGNYFETKEEAEKAVEKLKAWKRLKDKGFRFADKRYSGHIGIAGILLLTIEASIKGNDDTDVDDDLDLLFGGEE